MAKIDVQAWPVVLESTASLAASGSVAGSALCAGYAYVVGGIVSNASSTSGSALRVWQSVDAGAHWDFWTNYDLSACSGSMFSASIVGNAVKVEFRNGTTAASLLRCLFQLSPL